MGKELLANNVGDMDVPTSHGRVQSGGCGLMDRMNLLREVTLNDCDPLCSYSMLL